MARRWGLHWGLGAFVAVAAACSGGGNQHGVDAATSLDGGVGGHFTDAASGSAGRDGGQVTDAASTLADALADGDGGLVPPGVPPCRTLAPAAQQVQFAAGGSLLYVGYASDPAASVVDTTNWTVRQLFSMNTIPSFLGVISSDGKLVATIAGDGFLRVFSVANGAEMGKVAVALVGTAAPSYQSPPLVFSPDASRIAVVDSGTDLRVFSRVSLTQSWRVTAPGPVGWISFSADGQTLLAAVQGQVLRLDAASGKAAAPLTLPGATGAAAISGDGQTLALDSSSGTSIVRVADGTVLHTLASRASVFALSQDGALVAMPTSTGGVTVLDPMTGAVRQTLQPSASPDDIAFAPDGATIAVAADTNVSVWRLSDGHLVYEGGGRERTVFSPVSDTLASDNSSEAAFVWDVSSGAFLRRMPVTQRGDVIDSLSFESNGQLFVDAFSHGELWNLTQGIVTDVAYTPASQPPEWSGGSLITPDGKGIVSGGDAADLGAVRVWDASAGTVVRSFKAHAVDITALVMDRGGTLLATSGPEMLVQPGNQTKDFDIKIWDFAAGTLKQTLTGHTQSVFYLAFSTDGKWLLSGGSDGLVRLWSVADGSVVRDFATHVPNSSSITYGYGVVISPNGMFVASGGVDPYSPLEFVDVWSTTTGKLARRLAAWGGDWWTPSWSTDGQYLVTGGPAAINVWCVGDLGGAN